MIYLGINKHGHSVTGSEAILYTCIWKYLLAAYTKVDVDDATFDPDWILTSAISRLLSRVEAYAYKLKAIIKSHHNSGRPIPPTLTNNFSRNILPAARFDKDGNLQVTASLYRLAKAAGYYSHRGPVIFTEDGYINDTMIHLEYPSSVPHYNPIATRKLKAIWKAERDRYTTVSTEQLKLAKRNQ